MSDRLMARPLSPPDQLKLTREARERLLTLKLLVGMFGTPDGDARRVVIPADALRMLDAFAPFAVYSDPTTGDAHLILGKHEPPAGFGEVKTFATDRVRELATLLWKSTPHLENGANGDPTDRQDAKRLLREMARLGIEA